MLSASYAVKAAVSLRQIRTSQRQQTAWKNDVLEFALADLSVLSGMAVCVTLSPHGISLQHFSHIATREYRLQHSQAA